MGGIPGQILGELKNAVKDVGQGVATAPKQIFEGIAGGSASQSSDQTGKQLEQGQTTGDQQQAAAKAATDATQSGGDNGQKKLEVEKRMREIRARIQQWTGEMTNARVTREQQWAESDQKVEEEKAVKHHQEMQARQKQFTVVDALKQELGGSHESGGVRKH